MMNVATVAGCRSEECSTGQLTPQKVPSPELAFRKTQAVLLAHSQLEGSLDPFKIVGGGVGKEQDITSKINRDKASRRYP